MKIIKYIKIMPSIFKNKVETKKNNKKTHLL